MNEYVGEFAKAIIWMFVGLFPVAFGLAVNMYFDIRSLRKSINAAFAKIRAITGEEPGCRK